MSRKTRKLIWSVPLVAVFAVVGALAAFAAFAAFAPGVLFADELPDASQTLTVKAADGNTGRTTLVLNWEAPPSGAPDMYRIDVSKKNQKFTFLTEVSGTVLTYDHVVRPRGEDSDPKKGWKRFYRVYAKNSHRYGGVSTSESATTKAQDVPGEVGSVTYSSSDPDQITVKWAMPGDGGSDTLGYCVRVWPTGTTNTAPAPISDTTCLDKFASDGPGGSAGDYVDDDGVNNQDGDVIRTDATKTEYLHKNLRANQMWSYEVYAFNRHGHSETSSGVVNGESDGPNRPTYPGNVLALQVSSSVDDVISNVVNLYWTAPNDGGQDITRYEIEISDTSGHWPSQAFLDGEISNTANVPATAAATKVAAGVMNTTGQLNPDPEDTTGSQANVAVVWVSTDFGDDQDTATELGMPYQLRHTYTGSASDRVAGNVRTAASKLYYRVRTVTGSGSSQLMSAYTSGASVTIVDAKQATEEIPATATEPAIPAMPAVIFTQPIIAPQLDADANDGSMSDLHDSTTDTDPSNFHDEDGTGDPGDEDDDLVPGEIKLTLTTVVPGADSYRIDTSDDDGATWTISHDYTLPISRNDYDHRNLKPDEKLSFRFFAKVGTPLGLASNVVYDYAGNTNQPGNVRELVANTHPTDGAGKINLSWDAPEKNGGAAIEQYCILVNRLNENDRIGSNGVTRNSIFTQDYAAGAPGGGTLAMPANCTRLGESDAEDKNGVMTISVSGENTVFQVDHDTTMVTFTGLEQETRWQFEVFALNKASDTDVDNDGRVADANSADLDENGGRHALSEDSDEKRAGTGSAMAPMAPQRLTAQLAQDTDPEAIAGGVGNQGVLLLWNPPAEPVGAKVASYKIELKSDDGEFETEVATHTVNVTHWVDDTELGADETRTYRISATNAVGTGTEMATVMIPYPAADHTHPPGTVGDASRLTTAPGTAAGTAVLTWTEGDNANIHWVLGIAVNADDSFDFGDRKWMQVDSGSPYTVTGLTPGRMYSFAIISGHYDASLTPDTRWSEWTWAADVTVN